MLHPGPNFRSKAMDRAKVIALHCSSSGTRHWRGALAEALDYRCDLFTPERSNDAGPWTGERTAGWAAHGHRGAGHMGPLTQGAQVATRLAAHIETVDAEPRSGFMEPAPA
jgi:hypothetical protein